MHSHAGTGRLSAPGREYGPHALLYAGDLEGGYEGLGAVTHVFKFEQRWPAGPHGLVRMDTLINRPDRDDAPSNPAGGYLVAIIQRQAQRR